MTAGILLPAFVMIYFDLLTVGIVFSVGAMCVSISDYAGPILHRRNGMLVSNIAIFLVALITGWVAHSPLLLGITLFVFCFFFSMLGVYGARAGSIGIGALLVMILNIYEPRQDKEIVWNALYILGGGVWYMLFSLALYRIRPHKLIQQAIGDCIQSMADYLRTRASFYDRQFDYEAIYTKLLHQQVDVQEKQDLVNELLFKTSDIVQESTHTGRILVMIYLEAANLFEKVMTSYQDYKTLHEYFDATSILQRYHSLANGLSIELDSIGIALKSGKASVENTSLVTHIRETRHIFSELRVDFMKPENIEGFISLRYILDNIEDLSERIRTLHYYTTYDRKIKKHRKRTFDFGELVSHQEITPAIFIDNLSLKSTIFRHSLRVSIAVIAGYVTSELFTFGHSYWILLTIIVILKPAYSLTKQRNRDRLIGTVCGALIGVLILYFIKNNTALLIIMILLMTGTYSFIRKQYFIGVLLMTPYIVIFFYLLNPGNFTTILTDRVLDTAIGSVISFVASILLIPGWEHTTIKPLMIKTLEENRLYFSVITEAFTRKQPVSAERHQVARKNAFVALANLSNAFNRMLSEPKLKQKGIKEISQFVVLNHRLASHIATLSNYQHIVNPPDTTVFLEKVIHQISVYLDHDILILQGGPADSILPFDKDALRQLNLSADSLLEKRKSELQQGQLETSTKKALSELKSFVDQFNFIYKIAADIDKVSGMVDVE